MGVGMAPHGPCAADMPPDASEVCESGGVAITWEDLLGIGGGSHELAGESPELGSPVKPFECAQHGGWVSEMASLTSTRREGWRCVGDGPARAFDAELRRRRDLLMKTSGANRNAAVLGSMPSSLPSVPLRGGSDDRSSDTDQAGGVEEDEGGSGASSPSVEDSAIGAEGRANWLLFKDGSRRQPQRRPVGGRPELQVRRWRSDSSMGDTARRDASMDSRELPAVLQMVRSVPDIHRELALERGASPLTADSHEGRAGDERLGSSASWSAEYLPERSTEVRACPARLDSGDLAESVEDMGVDCCPWINLRYEDMLYTSGGRWAAVAGLVEGGVAH